MYRWAKETDKQAVMELWAVDFESYEPYYSWYFNTVYRPELTLCDFEGATLAGALQLSPYTLAWRGGQLPVCYVVGVITAPAFRKQGRGHALLTEAHEHMRAEGYAAALLYTDIPQFYAPMGYRHCYWQQTLNLPTADAVNTGEHNTGEHNTGEHNTGEHSSPLRVDDWGALAEIYAAMTARYDGYILRTERNWRVFLGEQVCDGARLLLWPGRAYVLYTQNAAQLHITELGFVDEAAARDALAAAALAAQAAGVTRLLWHAPDDAPGIFPHIPSTYWSLRPFVMARTHIDIAAMARPLWINEYT